MEFGNEEKGGANQTPPRDNTIKNAIVSAIGSPFTMTKSAESNDHFFFFRKMARLRK